jgi:hypothetical protein
MIVCLTVIYEYDVILIILINNILLINQVLDNNYGGVLQLSQFSSASPSVASSSSPRAWTSGPTRGLCGGAPVAPRRAHARYPIDKGNTIVLLVPLDWPSSASDAITKEDMEEREEREIFHFGLEKRTALSRLICYLFLLDAPVCDLLVNI